MGEKRCYIIGKALCRAYLEQIEHAQPVELANALQIRA
jgi:hypothetical protein